MKIDWNQEVELLRQFHQAGITLEKIARSSMKIALNTKDVILERGFDRELSRQKQGSLFQDIVAMLFRFEAESDQDQWVGTNDAYSLFCDQCDKMEVEPCNIGNFGKLLFSLYPSLEKLRADSNKPARYMFLVRKEGSAS